MSAERLEHYLRSHGIDYLVVNHEEAFTASQVAQTAHVRGREMAKSVIVKADGELVMAVLPATQLVDLHALREAIGAGELELATEEDFADIFTDCEVGAMPPFGNIYGLDVYVDESLADDEVIAFNACTHRRVFKMSYRDFDAYVRPRTTHFAVSAHH
jgi:Ala-tRNA(Pro) deacylase